MVAGKYDPDGGIYRHGREIAACPGGNLRSMPEGNIYIMA